MNALFIIVDFETTKEYLFNYTNQTYANFKTIIQSLGYSYKFIISTQLCINIKDEHSSNYKKLSTVNYCLGANSILKFKAEKIKQQVVNNNYIIHVFRAYPACNKCKEHSVTFKTTRACLFYPCTKNYKSLLCGKEKILY